MSAVKFAPLLSVSKTRFKIDTVKTCKYDSSIFPGYIRYSINEVCSYRVYLSSNKFLFS